MHPCIQLGSYVLDKARLPEDEFRLRMEPIYRMLDEDGLDAILVYGDARDHTILAYLTNFIPRMRWALALIPRRGSPRLLCSISSRDIPAMRTMTWLDDVYSGWEWKWFDEWLDKLGAGGSIATAGFDLVTPVLHAKILESLRGRGQLRDVSDRVGCKAVKRPREVSAMRAACALTEAAASVLATSFRADNTPEKAALTAERHARMAAAQDVRTLVSFDGGKTLRPFQDSFETRTERLLAYIAVKLGGYWADTFVAVNADLAETKLTNAALDRLIEAVRPGTPIGSLPLKLAPDLAEHLHPCLSGSVGHAIGLSLHDGPEFRAGVETKIEEGGIYALQVGTAGESNGILVSAIVHARAGGPHVLLRSVCT